LLAKPFKLIEPCAEPQLDGFTKLLSVIIGFELTVTVILFAAALQFPTEAVTK
jgi:hypothetical protein